MTAKNATLNGNFQPEIESNEYSSTRSSPKPWSVSPSVKSRQQFIQAVVQKARLGFLVASSFKKYHSWEYFAQSGNPAFLV